MSLESEEPNSHDQASERDEISHKKSKISYTRDFLLSLCELDICKRLPNGFDRSILSEFDNSSHNAQDRQRFSSGLLVQGFKRSDHGSFPPTRGDSNIYSRGTEGRWNTRSKDTDLQSDRDADSGKHYSNQSRRSWQNSEHDGLLGSGSFPRSIGYSTGMSCSKFQANDSRLNRSNEPYQPPRLYKAAPHSRRENTNDSYNDETFGSTECTSQDRAGQERKRRAAFDLLRKEQHKSIQEKHNLKPDKDVNDGVPHISGKLENLKEDKILGDRKSVSDYSIPVQVSHNDFGQSAITSHASASRPLVPPGFTRSAGTVSFVQPNLGEVEISDLEDNTVDAKGNSQSNDTFHNLEEKKPAEKSELSELQHETSIHLSFGSIHEPSLNSDVSFKMICSGNLLQSTSSPAEPTELISNGEAVKLDPERVEDMLHFSNDNISIPILKNLSGSVLTVNNVTSHFVEHHGEKGDIERSPGNVSSKFAHWFAEEEKNSADDVSSGSASNLLSLIVGGENVALQASDAKPSGHATADLPFQSSELGSGMPKLTTGTDGISEQVFNDGKLEVVPTVLTCEDLEQSMLSEIRDDGSTLHLPLQRWSVSESREEQPKSDVDNHASQHLLSLLQKGAGSDVGPSSSPNARVGPTDNWKNSEVDNNGSAGKPLTLETLFGTAFMQELQSAEAPVSAQRGSVGPASSEDGGPHNQNFPTNDDDIFPSAVDDPQIKLGKIGGHLSGFDSSGNEADSSNLQNQFKTKFHGFDGAVDAHLPEEDSLLTIGDSMVLSEFLFKSESLAVSNGVFRDERSRIGCQEASPYAHGSFDVMGPGISYRKLHAQPPPTRPPPYLMESGRPMFHSPDIHPTNINSQMRFNHPEHIAHRHAPLNHQVYPNMSCPSFNNPYNGLNRFDIANQNLLLQRMRMPSNLPPSHHLGFPHGAPLPPHPNHHPTSFLPELSPVEGLPFSHREANYAGLRMSMPGAPAALGLDMSGHNNPEALRRLIGMELASSPKQIPPFVGHPSRTQGHERDMEFRYR